MASALVAAQADQESPVTEEAPKLVAEKSDEKGVAPPSASCDMPPSITILSRFNFMRNNTLVVVPVGVRQMSDLGEWEANLDHSPAGSYKLPDGWGS